MTFFYKGYGTLGRLLNINLPSGKYIREIGDDMKRLAMTKVITGLLAGHELSVEQVVRMLVNPKEEAVFKPDASKVLIPMSQLSKLIVSVSKGEPFDLRYLDQWNRNYT